ncbi:hypothetical protein N9Y86_05285 [Flavobacteriaceae bacterium]|jgi:hypothetical protein|nr:hypothetical protein [Flavobacteriaceae bacterium]MDA9984838.1 hypothetical protein [Flavobacteriaceae bacterium]MDB2673295.1 hypothetical protein [Flavobacteriaceae bacterium]MDB9941323.1 hypothetical protein [Flavobacteriaceae bacterium]MDC1401672.1 hypothetical protein [Flavobacteriaceae bacterium]|tara:strand:- start:437 stop:877 length:441 start_codon:yes stop_codon:yes gene_type:complete
MEIFGYIFIGIIVLYILGFIVNLFSNDKTITVEELSIHVTDWFIEMYPIRKKSPRIVISDESSDFAGTFTFYNNTITLFTQNVSDYDGIVEITLHELVHWREITSHSKDQFYDKQLKEFGYENHPQEIWCRAVAAELSKQYIKQKM